MYTQLKVTDLCTLNSMEDSLQEALLDIYYNLYYGLDFSLYLNSDYGFYVINIAVIDEKFVQEKFIKAYRAIGEKCTDLSTTDILIYSNFGEYRMLYVEAKTSTRKLDVVIQFYSTEKVTEFPDIFTDGCLDPALLVLEDLLRRDVDSSIIPRLYVLSLMNINYECYYTRLTREDKTIIKSISREMKIYLRQLNHTKHNEKDLLTVCDKLWLLDERVSTSEDIHEQSLSQPNEEFIDWCKDNAPRVLLENLYKQLVNSCWELYIKYKK